MARLLIALALAPLLSYTAGCDRESPSAPTSAAPPPPAPPDETLRRFAVSGEAAFDLIAAPGGALLAWAHDRRISVALLDPRGTERAPPRVIATAETAARVEEVAARASSRATAIAWIERKNRVAVLRHVLGDEQLGSFTQPSLLASAGVGASGRRGNLAIAGDGDRLVAFHRAEPEPCIGNPDRECTRIAFSELAGQTPRPRRIPLSVPAACAATIAGFVVSKSRWHYAVCSTSSGRPSITTFRIQYDPRYAEAHEVLRSCTPAGAIPLGDDVIVAADCPEGRRAARVGKMGTTPVELDLSAVDIGCELGHPVLRAKGAPGFELRLDAPMDGLGSVLPPLVAPQGARAAWTGGALIIARYVAGNVVLSRFGCSGGDWTRLGPKAR